MGQSPKREAILVTRVGWDLFTFLGATFKERALIILGRPSRVKSDVKLRLNA